MTLSPLARAVLLSTIMKGDEQNDKMADRKREETFIPMDSASRKRVGDQSTQRKRKTAARGRRSTKKTTRKRRASSPPKWPLQDPGILAEKKEKGRIFYLVAWADIDPKTNRPYTPTWEPCYYVSTDVIEDWLSRKSSSVEPASTLDEVGHNSERHPTLDQRENALQGTFPSSQDSEPPRPAKRRRTQGPNPTTKDHAVESTTFPSAGNQSLEIPDSYESIQPQVRAGRAIIEIPVRDSFDREAYARVPISSSPSQSAHPSPGLSSSQLQTPGPTRGIDSSPSPSTRPSPGLSYSQIQTQEPRHRFSSVIWDEAIDERIIPDSQDKSGSASYEPSATSVSKTSSSLRENPGSYPTADVIQDPSAESPESSPSNLHSEIVDSGLAEPLHKFTHASPLPSPPQALAASPWLLTVLGSAAATPARTQISVQSLLQSIETVGNVSMDSTMDEPFDPSDPLRDLFRLRAAEAIAKHTAAREAAAREAASQASTPSLVVPAIIEQVTSINEQAVAANQILPAQDGDQITIPTLESILSPETDVEPEVETDEEKPVGATSTGLWFAQGPEEYAVPLPMVSHAREVYEETLKKHKSLRLEFVTDENPALIKDIDSMLADLDSLCNHQDLIVDDHSTQKLDTIEEQAKWAENVSTKCIFLVEFLASLQTEEKQVAILVRPGRMLEILEALFQWHGFVYNRADQATFYDEKSYTGNKAGGPMRINVYPTKGDIFGYVIPSIVIAFDSTYAVNPELLTKLQTDSIFPVPLLTLLVANSIEHLDKCFEDSPARELDRKIQLVSCLTQIAQDERVGKLDAVYHNPPNAASAVAQWVTDENSEWPLLPMPTIDGIDLLIENRTQSEPTEDRRTKLSVQPLIDAIPQLSSKRDLDASNKWIDSPKRQKLSPIPGQEPSHISNTVLHTSSAASAEVTEMIAKAAGLDEEQGDQVSMLLKKVNELETLLRSRDAQESELHQINQDLERRCKDYESSIAFIQTKYQEALNERGEFEHEKNLVFARNQSLKRDFDSKVAEVTRLREQLAAISAELAEARGALSSSTIPDITEFFGLKEELFAERLEKQRLEKKLGNMQSDLEYMRDSYQKASTIAARNSADDSAVQAELAELREIAKGNMVRIHEIQNSREVAEHLRHINALNAEKGELIWQLERKDEELRALQNGRRGTRGTSVPRSPRMGTAGTMSPGPRPRGGMQMGGIGMAMSGAGSRGTSPVPGELGGAFRGVGQFGEPIFQDGGRGVRWGTHLQQ